MMLKIIFLDPAEKQPNEWIEFLTLSEEESQTIPILPYQKPPFSSAQKNNDQRPNDQRPNVCLLSLDHFLLSD